MPTFTAFATADGEAAAEALGEAVEALDPAPYGLGVFEVEDGSGRWEVGAYFHAAPDAVALALLAAAHQARGFVVSELPETDWVAHVRRELAPVAAGRFFVYGSHDADKVPEGAVALLIEAAMAFGTGHHATTQGCLRALEAVIPRFASPPRVADIGCGTAVLALAAARVWPGEIIASDIDAVAVETALANAAVNGLEGRIRCIEAAGFDHAGIAAAAPFDLVFANILMAPLVALTPDMARAMAPGGLAILSGILNAQADAVRAAYAAEGLEALRAEVLGDWTTLVMGRPHA